ncbi:MAG: GxxExxY protein [Proteobacteria bacterium]|nr:GxxExxY protein [Pseudomonadota bacterium]
MGISVEAQVPVKVYYKGNIIGDYIADILIEEKVIIELKTVEKIDKIHEAQFINYLKATVTSRTTCQLQASES